MGAGSESTWFTWPRHAWRIFSAGSRGPYAPPVLAQGNTDRGGGQARREQDNLKQEISWWRPRPGPARKTVVSSDSYFYPVAFVYCVGFWRSVHFFRLNRNGYFKIESRPDARLTLPRPNTMVFGVLCAPSYARVCICVFSRQRFTIPPKITLAL